MSDTSPPLSGFDDLPVHQGFGPIGRPETSDVHFNDGYYAAFYAPGVHVFCGLRLHPNTNVMDGYAGAVVHGRQRSVRVSRALRPRIDELEVGPFRMEILEPMRRHRLVLADAGIGLEFDVVWTASAPEFVEAPHVQYRHGTLLNHVLRYVQVGRAQGTLTVDGESTTVHGWHGARDHSWGIRSTMGPRTPIGGLAATAGPGDPRAMRLWVPFEAGGVRGFFHTHADADGRTLDVDGRLDLPDGTAAGVVGVEHELHYRPGSRRLSGGRFVLRDEHGSEHGYTFEVACDPAHPQGFGYTRGWSDGGGPGVYRGEGVAETDRFDVSTDEPAGPAHVPAERRLGGTEFVSTLRADDGATGMAHVEHMRYGPRTT